jgi:hypothetical protein
LRGGPDNDDRREGCEAARAETRLVLTATSHSWLKKCQEGEPGMNEVELKEGGAPLVAGGLGGGMMSAWSFDMTGGRGVSSCN